MHHPFTTPSPASLEHLESTDQKTLENLTADAYDLVINGVEIGGGSFELLSEHFKSGYLGSLVSPMRKLKSNLAFC